MGTRLPASPRRQRPTARLVPRDHALADPGDRAAPLPRDAALPHRSASQPGGPAPGEGAPLRGGDSRAARRGAADERRLLPPGGPAVGRARGQSKLRIARPSPGSSRWSRGRSRGLAATPLRAATRAEVDAHWHGAPPTDELYRGRLEVAAGGEPFAVGEQRGIVVRVENHGSHVWPQGGVGWPVVAVAYRCVDDGGEIVVGEGLRTRLPATLRPGGSLLMSVDVLAPPVPGAHVLVLDLLHEHVRWFGCELRLPLDVRRGAQRRAPRRGRREREAGRRGARRARTRRPSPPPHRLARRDERAPRLRGGARRARLRPGETVGRACAGRPARSAVPGPCSGTPRCDAWAAGLGSPRPAAPSTSRG